MGFFDFFKDFNPIKSVTDFVTGIPEKVKSVAGNLYETARTATESVIGAVRNDIIPTVTSVISSIPDKFEQAVDYATKIQSKVTKSIGESAANVIGGAIGGTLSQTAKGAGDLVDNTLNKSFFSGPIMLGGLALGGLLLLKL